MEQFKALTTFRYGGRRLKPGDTFSPTKLHSKMMVVLGLIEKFQEKKQEFKSTYQELKPSYQVESLKAESNISPRTGKPKREYKRRDMKVNE